MRQVVITRYGGPEVLATRTTADPVAGRGEVVIAVAGAGVNFADLAARAGLYPDAPPPPMVVGYEVAGTVVSVGAEVDTLAVGDPVMAVTRFGGYAEAVAVPTFQVARLHPGAEPVAAAGVPVVFLTAYVMLCHLGAVRPGNTVLIHSAGGGVGLAALQLARNLGAVTIGTASTKKHARLAEMGVDHAIDYRTQDFEREVLRLTNGRGVDVALDAVGGTSMRKSYRCLAPLGRLFCFGMSAANAPSRAQAWRTLPKAVVTTPLFPALSLMNANRGVYGINLGHLWGERDLLREGLGALAAMWAGGPIAPVIDATFPFDDAALAHQQLGRALNFGKVVLTP
jgi:synaptic vesicle membrane protein VAT-1